MHEDTEVTDKINMNARERVGGELVHLPLDWVVPSTSNPRLHLDKEPFAELKKSIRENGLLQPIVVRAAGDRYEIIGGHRRFAAVSQLAREQPDDARFRRIASMAVEADDALLPVLQLAENVNRADLAPLEIAEGAARAIENGASADQVAASLGWNRRQLNRYLQLNEAPQWLKDALVEVKVQKQRMDATGAAAIDPVTRRPVVDVERHAVLAFSHVSELITSYNVLREEDALRLAEGSDGDGDGFQPRAERIVRRLAGLAAAEGWASRGCARILRRRARPRRASERRQL